MDLYRKKVEAFRQMTPEDQRFALGRLEGELYTSANGVTQQARRLREDHQPGSEYLADGRALAYFLRDAIRIAETIKLLVDPGRASDIEAALKRVEDVCPDAVNARDALEHADDYVLGVGRQQKDAPGPYAQLYVRGVARLHVRVGDLEVDIDLAERSAQHLASVVLAGTDPLGLLPLPDS